MILIDVINCIFFVQNYCLFCDLLALNCLLLDQKSKIIDFPKSTNSKLIGDKTMANINIANISDLNLNGNDLFEDSESFMKEVNDESEQVIGGKPVYCLLPTCQATEGECVGSRSIVIALAPQQ